MRDFRGGHHAAPHERDLAAVFLREIQNLLEPVNGAAEASDDQAPRRADEQIFQARTDGSLAFGVAGAVDVGRIRHEQQHAFFAVGGEGVQIEQLVIGGRGIDLEIAGMNDHAERRGDGERDALDNRMRDVDEFN